MRSVALTLMPLLFSLGCAASGTTGTENRTDLRQNSCSPHQHAVKHSGRSTEPCRSQRVWLEQVGPALGGAAAAVRIPSQ